MKFGIQLPNFGPFSEVDRLLAMAQQAESAGWDGFFLWDHVNIHDRMADSMTVLAAIATVTSRIAIGPMITGPSRRRPWKLAREATTIDHLSKGRFVLGIGLGAEPRDFDNVGEVVAPKPRAQKMDEALAIMDALWQGETVTHHGDHFDVDDLHFEPRPVQSPRVPIWVAGLWPNKPPMRRAAKWDGAFPIGNGYTLSPDEWREIIAYVNQHRTDATAPYEFVHSGITPSDRDAALATVTAYAEAGVTWWLEDISPVRVGWTLGAEWPEPWPVDEIVARIAAGPPKK
ncbi:MAG: LLM class flavin-dependent oxidoreductase [Anaerolineae bacterium]|nr:LLM class flavin-dependent oxidoreductase [Anaerolineae bacterium]